MKKIIVFLSLLIISQVASSQTATSADRLEAARLVALADAAREVADNAAQVAVEAEASKVLAAEVVAVETVNLTSAESLVAETTEIVTKLQQDVDADEVRIAALIEEQLSAEAAAAVSLDDVVEAKAIALSALEALTATRIGLVNTQEIAREATDEAELRSSELGAAEIALAEAEIHFIRYRDIKVPVGINTSLVEDEALAAEASRLSILAVENAIAAVDAALVLEAEAVDEELSARTQLEQAETTAVELQSLAESSKLAVDDAAIAQQSTISDLDTAQQALIGAIELVSEAELTLVAVLELLQIEETATAVAVAEATAAEIRAIRARQVADQATDALPNANLVAISFDGLDNRTDSGARLTGRLTSNGEPANTWFIFRRTTDQSLGNDDCGDEPITSQKLSFSGDVHRFTVSSLESNTAYQVGFCGRNSDGLIRLGGSDEFTTKRNSSTIVEHSCTNGGVFRSEDGPLNIIVDAEGFNTDRDADTAFIRVNNSGNSGVDITIKRDGFAGSQLRLEGQAPRRRNSNYSVRVPRTDSDYNVKLSEDSNWTATFTCSIVECIQRPISRPRVCENVQNLELRAIFE